MTTVALAPPATILRVGAWVLTQTAQDVTDRWDLASIRRAAAVQGISLIEDGLPAGVQQGVDAMPEPQSFEWDWTFPPPVIIAGGWNAGVVAGLQYGRYGYGYNLSNTTGSEWRWRVPVSKGSWRLDVMADKDPSRAIQTWEISYDNGATWNLIGTWDQYNPATNPVSQSASLFFTCPLTGVALLRIRNPTRNPAQSYSWYWTISVLRLTRTA